MSHRIEYGFSSVSTLFVRFGDSFVRSFVRFVSHASQLKNEIDCAPGSAPFRSVQYRLFWKSTLTWIIAASQSSTDRTKMFVFSVQNILCFGFCVPFGPTWLWEICVVKTEKAHWCLSILRLKFVMCMLQTSHEKKYRKKTSKQPNRVCWSKDYTRNLLEKKEHKQKTTEKNPKTIYSHSNLSVSNHKVFYLGCEQKRNWNTCRQSDRDRSLHLATTV